jgi:hypothetical protein
MPDDPHSDTSQGSMLSRVFRIIHHEATSIPLTFAASLIVVIPVVYGAVQFLISPSSFELPVVNFPSVSTPIPGLNILIKGCTFLVLQWAVSTLYARSVQFLSRRTNTMALMPAAIIALVYGWLSTFASYILWVTAAPHLDGAVLALVVVFIVSLFILAQSTPEEGPNEWNYPVFIFMFGAVALIVFSVVFGIQAADHFNKSS